MTSTFEERKNQVKKIKDSFQQLTKGTELSASSSSSTTTATNSWYYDHLNMSTTATRRLNRSTSNGGNNAPSGLPPRSPSVGSSGSSSSKRLASSYHVVPMTMEEEETNSSAHYKNNRLPQPKVFPKKNNDNYEYDVDDVVQDLIHDMEEGAGSVSGGKRGGVLDDDSLMNETDFASTHTSGGGHHSSYHTSTSSYVNESDDDDDDDDVIQNNHHQGNHDGTFYTEEKINDDDDQHHQGDVASEYGEPYNNEGDEDDDGLFARSTDPEDIRRAAIAMINAEEGGTTATGTVSTSSSSHIYNNNTNGDVTGGVLSDHEYEMLAEVTSRRGPKKSKKKKIFQRVEKGYHYHALDGSNGSSTTGGCVQQIRDFVVHVIMFRDGKSCATILFLIGFFVMMATIMIDVAVKNANDILASTSSEQVVPPPSATIQRVCSKHYYDELGNGLDDCRDACAPGACCNAVDQSQNCFASNMEHCSTYTVCLVLDRIDEDSPAAQGKPLNDIMTDMTMMPMGAMHEVMAPPPDIKQVCNEDQMNSIKEGGSCQVMCEEAKCCFDADTVNNCYSFSVNNQETCEVYRTHCMYLGEPYGGYPTKLVDPPSNLEELCSSDYIEANGVLMCQMACEHGDCCFNEQYPNSHGPCYDLLQESCQKYESCSILLQQPLQRQKDVTTYGYNDNDDDEEEDNAMNIYYNDETVDVEEQDEYEGSTVTVSTHMDNGDEEDATPDYYEDENDNDMNIYYSENDQDNTIADEPTANNDEEYYNDEDEESSMNSVMVVVPKPISTLNRICNSLLFSKDDEDNDLEEQCREECSKARCCVSGLENDPDFDCFDEYNERHCLMYLPCYTVNPDFAQLMDHPLLEEVIVRPVALVQDSWSLEDTCTKASDENDETAQRLCLETCAGAQCCVSETPEMNCFETYKEQCLDYQSCVHVYPNEFSFMTTTTDLDSVNGEQQPTQTQQHEPLPMPSVDLEDVCSFDSLNNNSQKKKQCMEECSEAHCCFRDDPFFPTEDADEAYYCGESNYDECLVYQPCERLWQDVSDSMSSSSSVEPRDGHDHSTSSKVPLPPNQLDQICDATLIANDSDMMQECMEYCLKAECCFMEDDDPDSCIDYVDECYDYQPCEHLHEWYLGGQESQSQGVEEEDEYTNTEDDEETTATSVMVSTSISNVDDTDEVYYDAEMTVVVEEPTEDVNAICSKVAYGDVNSIDECTNICTPASDCCVSSDESNCFKDNAATCVKYLACVAIDERYATMLMTKEEEFQSIEDAQLGTTAEDEDDYEMNIYYEDENELFVLPPPSDQLEFVCSDKSLEVSDAACQVFCKISECCFHVDDNEESSSCTDNEECINYQICSKMFPISNSRDVRGNE